MALRTYVWVRGPLLSEPYCASQAILHFIRQYHLNFYLEWKAPVRPFPAEHSHTHCNPSRCKHLAYRNFTDTMVRFYHFYGELVRTKLQRCLIGKAIEKAQQTILFFLFRVLLSFFITNIFQKQDIVSCM